MTKIARWLAGKELWLVLAMAPFLLFPGMWSPAAAALILLAWLCRWVVAGHLLGAAPADVPTICLLAAAGVGLYTSVHRDASLGAFWSLFLGFAIYFAMANWPWSPKRLRLLVLSMAAAGLGLSALTLFGTRWEVVRLLDLPQLYAGLPALFRDPQDSQAFNPRIMGMALATLLPVFLTVAAFGRESRLRLASLLAALITVAVLPLTQSVQAALGLVCALFFLALAWSRRTIVPILGVAALVIVVLIRSDFRPLATRLVSTGDLAGIGVALRLDMWGRALAMLRDMPFTGIGLDSFPAIQSNFYPGYLIGPEPHAHNLFLQLALDLGLPGLLAFIWLLMSTGAMAFLTHTRLISRDERALVLGATAGIVSYLGAGLIDTPSAGKPGILLWVLVGTLAATHRLSAAADAQPSRRLSELPRHVPLSGVAPAFLLVLGLVTLPGVRTLNMATLDAHRTLYDLRSGATMDAATLESSERLLDKAITEGNHQPQVYSLLGNVRAWLGDDGGAGSAFEQQVSVDIDNPQIRYVPFEAMRRWIAKDSSGNPAAELLQVYGQWMARFPDRADSYLRSAIVREHYQGDPSEAEMVLRAGLDRGAEPRGLLEYGLSQLLMGVDP